MQRRYTHDEEAGSTLLPGRRNFSFSALHQRVLEQYAPPSVIVNRDSKIVHMSDNARRFLRYVGGEPSSNLIAVRAPNCSSTCVPRCSRPRRRAIAWRPGASSCSVMATLRTST